MYSTQLKKNHVHRFIHCGTEAALVGGGSIINANEEREIIPAGIDFPYSRTKAMAELLVREYNSEKEGEMSTVVCRPRLIWGLGDTVVLKQMIDAVNQGQWVSYYNNIVFIYP